MSATFSVGDNAHSHFGDVDFVDQVEGNIFHFLQVIVVGMGILTRVESLNTLSQTLPRFLVVFQVEIGDMWKWGQGTSRMVSLCSLQAAVVKVENPL